MNRLLIKVCGMRQPDNIAALAGLNPDFMGFIFYEKSPRHAADLDQNVLRECPPGIKKVGVFVNAPLESILAKADHYGLDFIQLHGDEPAEFAARLKQHGLHVIKVFRIAESLPPDMAEFAESSEYFLFDTATKAYGGSGEQFNWSLLREAHIPRPYLLSGGIAPGHIADIKSMRLPGCLGIDINSRFETAPGLKNIELIQQIIPQL
jgi:phosphoribosylanthranilate isomerase